LTELEDAGGDPDLIRALGTAARAAGANDDILAALTAAFKDARTMQDGTHA
jgi:hypothetical protein